MDWSKYKPLLVKANEQQIALALKTQLATQSPELMKVMACLEDGTIDRGDAEQVAGALLKLVLDLPEYQEMARFAKAARAEYSEMYRALAAASDADYAKFIELQQEIATEMGIDAMLNVLVQGGMVVDNRPKTTR
jgi:hypothetical protein